MEKYLIINADDFGMCRAANLATFDLFEKGGISSATIMMPCPWAPEAVKWAASHPEYAVGDLMTSEWSTTDGICNKAAPNSLAICTPSATS